MTRLFFTLRLWLLRSIANGDAVAMNFTSDEDTAIRITINQQLFCHNHHSYRIKTGLLIVDNCLFKSQGIR